MRLFELILSILAILTGIIKLIPDIPKKYRNLLAPFLLVLGAIAQLTLEGDLRGAI